ncbi:MAG: M23 family peptidase [Pseudolabrys sp.]|nr:M23 family peptidase [Pseudolabrys sp.]
MKIRLSAIALMIACTASAAAAQDFLQPRVTMSSVQWPTAAYDVGDGPTDEIFAMLNADTNTRFAGIERSTVPVLLPMDVAAFRKDKADLNADAAASNKYFGEFSPSKFFHAGPAGYDATFWINPREYGIKSTWPKPVEVEIGGAAFVYDLQDPNHQEVFPPPKESGLAEKFPGIRRILRENHVRYAFERFGVPYVVSIQCYDRRPSAKIVACREADELAIRFLKRLTVAGGTPTGNLPEPKLDLARPEHKSDFTYYGPGNLIPNSGWRKNPGREDYTVYARLRFPFAQAPAYIKSQAFLHWGDCYRTGIVGRKGRKDASYHCKVNDKPLVFNEAHPENWSYPWRDNFCEWRDFLVGQCPGGYGHQAQDMRPSNCVLSNEGADRCLPYQHAIAAAADGPIWRSPGYLAAFLFLNTANERVRVSYLHMNPTLMDNDGLVSGRAVSAGEILGKVSNWGDHEHGTSYHLHFSMQVFTRSGWVWVNPYMTLVASYERLTEGRGTEIKPGDPEPVIPDKKPVILNPAPVPAVAATPDSDRPKPAAKPARHKPKKKKVRRRSKRADAD